MFRILVTTVSCCAVLLTTNSYAKDLRPAVAVYDIQYRGIKLKPAVRKELYDLLVKETVETGFFQVTRKLKPYKTISTSITRIGPKCLVTANLYDQRKAATEMSSSFAGKCALADFKVLLEKSVDKLVSKKRKAKEDKKPVEIHKTIETKELESNNPKSN